MKRLLIFLILLLISTACFTMGGPGFDSYRDLQTYEALQSTAAACSEYLYYFNAADAMLFSSFNP